MRRFLIALAVGALAASAQAAEPDPSQTRPSMAVGRTHDCSSYVPEESVRQWETGDILVGYDVGVDGVISNVQLLKTVVLTVWIPLL